MHAAAGLWALISDPIPGTRPPPLAERYLWSFYWLLTLICLMCCGARALALPFYGLPLGWGEGVERGWCWGHFSILHLVLTNLFHTSHSPFTVHENEFRHSGRMSPTMSGPCPEQAWTVVTDGRPIEGDGVGRVADSGLCMGNSKCHTGINAWDGSSCTRDSVAIHRPTYCSRWLHGVARAQTLTPPPPPGRSKVLRRFGPHLAQAWRQRGPKTFFWHTVGGKN